MKRVPALAILFAVIAASAAAAPPPKLDRSALEPRRCGKGRLVVDVVQKVRNDVETGTKGNYWAFDDYVRRIRVWRTGTNVFCAIAVYDGKFTTIAGPSPGGTGDVPAGLQGHFRGGFRMDFTASLRPAKPTRGSIGTYDYRCDAAGRCPGRSYWLSFYFRNVSGDDFDWWGWEYRGGKHGTWVNAISGSKGDIVFAPKEPPPPPKKPKK